MQIKRVFPIVFLFFSLVACDLLSPPVVSRPTVISTSPGNEDQNVSVDTDISAQLELVDGSAIDSDTLGNGTVRLKEAGTDVLLSGTITTSGETINFDPDISLKADTSYSFEITDGVEDENNNSVQPYSITFATFSANSPIIARVDPPDGATDVDPTNSVSLYPDNTAGGLDNSTNTPSNVRLIEVGTNAAVDAVRGTSGGFDIITLNPTATLKEDTAYRIEVTDDVKDQSGNAFIPFTSTFTTGKVRDTGSSDIRFSRQTVVQDGDSYSSLAIGPDRKLYATTVDGRIKRFPINTDGTLGSAETITSLQENERTSENPGGIRLLIGFAFDPSSTPDNLIAWVSHTYVDPEFKLMNIDEPWSGKITRLSGPDLGTVEDYVVGLPRSSKDHVTNGIAFNPGEPNVLYFNQGSNSAMGAPDSAWDYQQERLLSGATLRLDISTISSPPLNVQTEDGGSYNPFAANAPLTLYGRGVRNAYDLVWHSNGELYVPANGSNLGGIVPRYDPIGNSCSTRPEGTYNGPKLTEPDDVDGAYINDGQTDGWKVGEQVQSDFLFRVEKDGYYGHPNPKRCEWILNGGGTSNDASRVNIYKSTTQPDPNYRGFAYDFAKNKSPNGVIEYKSDALGGILQGKLLVVRYSNENDILVMDPNGPNNDISSVEESDDLGDFQDPIDLIEDTTNGGNLYVSEYDAPEDTNLQRITLLRPAN